MIKDITDVIFRKYRDGELIALFPAIPGTDKWYADCMSYQTIGQHGSCGVDLSTTKPAHWSEYKELKAELEAIGYNLKVVPRFKQAHVTARKMEVLKVK